MKLYGAGWKTKFFASAGVSMIGRVCGVSQYPKFCKSTFRKVSRVTASILGEFLG